MTNTPAVSSNPKRITTTTTVTTTIAVTLLLLVSVGSLVAVLVMDIMSSLDGVLTATVTISELAIVGITLVVMITVDRNKLILKNQELQILLYSYTLYIQLLLSYYYCIVATSIFSYDVLIQYYSVNKNIATSNESGS